MTCRSESCWRQVEFQAVDGNRLDPQHMNLCARHTVEWIRAGKINIDQVTSIGGTTDLDRADLDEWIDAVINRGYDPSGEEDY